MESHLEKYRAELVATEEELKASYDKLIVTLLGGALGLYMALLKNIVHISTAQYKWLLLLSRSSFIASLALVLRALSFRIEVYRRAIYQVDVGTIYQSRAAAWFSNITRNFRRLSAIALLAELVSISFSIRRHGQNPDRNHRQGLSQKLMFHVDTLGIRFQHRLRLRVGRSSTQNSEGWLRYSGSNHNRGR